MNAMAPGNPGGPPANVNALANALALVILGHGAGAGGFPIGAAAIVQLQQNVLAVLQANLAVLQANIRAILGGAIMTAGIAAILPSLTVIIVNAVGFTAAGVAKGMSCKV